jgi:LacI family transcriptional regulator, galactose operon repressor
VVTLYDVARLAGVSTATVSRVVHGQDRVREGTRIRVQRAIEELGYVPDGAAQSLSRRRKDVIGMVCVEREAQQYDIENMNLLFYDEVLRGVEARIRDEEWSLLITFLQGANDPGFPRLESFSGKVDGILIGEGIVPDRFVERMAARVPVVIFAGTPDERAADVVTADNFSGSAAVVNHLIRDHGKRRLFFVNGPADSPDTRERRLALDHILWSNPDCQLIGSHQGYYSVRSGEDAGEKLLALPRAELPDAVVSANDQMAIGILKALASAGIRVPEDVAVTGFDDIFPGSLCDPPLTTVHQPMRLLGERACARLLDRIANPGLPPAVELLPTELVLRSSCGCPAGTVIRRPVETLTAARLSSAGAQPGRRGTDAQAGSHGTAARTAKTAKPARPTRQAAKA